MQLSATIAELDRMIVRIAVSRDMQRMRIEAMPDSPERQLEKHELNELHAQLLRLRDFRKAIVARRPRGCRTA